MELNTFLNYLGVWTIGSVTRDVLLNDIPGALTTNPWYLILCLAAASLALATTSHLSGRHIRRTFDFMATFSLPWYAIIGTQKVFALTSITYVILYALGLADQSVCPATFLAWLVGFGFRNASNGGSLNHGTRSSSTQAKGPHRPPNNHA